jgi:uncharacterized protein YecT (DUF1311 family)
MKVGILALGSAALLMAAACAGRAGATSPAYDKCTDKTDGVTSSMRECNSAEAARQDRDLNAFYKQAMARRDAAGREQLRTQERAWLKRRLSECHKILNEDDGTDSLLNYDGCWLDMTDKRITELKALANGHP